MNRDEFETILLNEGEDVKNGTCPLCEKWINSMPDTQIRPYKGKRSMVKIWECFNCEKEFVQVYLPNEHLK